MPELKFTDCLRVMVDSTATAADAPISRDSRRDGNSFKKPMRTFFTSKGVLTFGKHNGKSYAEVAFKDPSWVRWSCENVDGFREAMHALTMPKGRTRRTPQKKAEDDAFKKLSHNERLQQITERVRARDGMDEAPVHGFLDAFTSFDDRTAPY